MRRNFLSVLLLSVFVLNSVAWGQVAVKLTPAERQEVEAITADQMRNYLYFVASDEMEGRDTPSRGLDTTAKFIGMNLARWGFKPAGDDGTFFQKIALRRDVMDTAHSSAKINGQEFKVGEDFIPSSVA